MSRKWWYGIIEILPMKKKYSPFFGKVLRDYTNHPYYPEDSSLVCAIQVDLPCDLAIKKFRAHLLKRHKGLRAADFELLLTKHFPMPQPVANRPDILFISAERCGFGLPRKQRNKCRGSKS